MIQKQEVMGLLLSACPSYKERWDRYLKENYSYGEEQLLYIDLCDFASHIVELYAIRQIQELPAVFDIIE
ncbi:hypothetical protein NK662_18015 [Ectobacillus sp. SYSU M60031]|uniref:DUF7674 domain-containing protein n=1 Tax=Ectobacillus ponti TaxID=2961894 RepID=A0AA41X7M6_9BACI|nr:hypothetical protein [Ectobacillus ponti]MCP8970416.1 hypothetical protein [Ectobacillus ponti]